MLRNLSLCLIGSTLAIFGFGQLGNTPQEPAPIESTRVATSESNEEVIVDHAVELCQGYQECQCPSCTGQVANGWYPDQPCQADYGNNYGANRRGYAEQGDVRMMVGVDASSQKRHEREAHWKDQRMVPWESRAYGEYIGPYRTPHVPEYRLRVGDQLEFVYVLSRRQSQQAYEINVGDEIQILSSSDTSLNQPSTVQSAGGGLEILSDGTVSLQLIGQVRAAGKSVAALQEELNDRYTKFVKKPAIVVQVVKANTRLKDLIESVTAVAGQGGQVRGATISPDGTVQLPIIGSVPAIGLSMHELGREVTARYQMKGLEGVNVTPTLTQRASRFIYVLGEVTTPGRFELVGPTSAMQSIALAEGFLQGGNLRQIVVFRRDANWGLGCHQTRFGGSLVWTSTSTV